MSTPDYSGPAFPQNCEQRCSQHYHYSDAGMTMRDYFAAHCPSDLAKVNCSKDAELLAGPKPLKTAPFLEIFAWNNKVEAAIRYAYADAMLSERNKNK